MTKFQAWKASGGSLRTSNRKRNELPNLYPHIKSRAGREGVKAVAVISIAAALVVVGAWLWYLNSSLLNPSRPTPVVSSRFATLTAVAVVGTATPDLSGIGGLLVSNEATPTREMRPFGWRPGDVIGPIESTAESTEVDIMPAISNEVALAPTATATPWPYATRASIEPFKVYVFQQPEMVNQFVVEYPYLVLTAERLPPGVSVLQAGREGGFSTFTPVPTTVCPWANLNWCEGVSFATPPAPAAAALAVGAAERFSGAAPLAHSGRIQRAP